MLSETILPGLVPNHVPASLVRDFDIYDFEGAFLDIHEAWHRMANREPDVFFTPRNGGFWVVTRPDLLEAIWPDGERFSSAKGISVPPPVAGSPAMLPIESDDPVHKALRRPLEAALSPKEVRLLSETARELCISLIDELQPKGGCDFVADFSLKMPMELFLRLVDLPSRDREWLVGLASGILKTGDEEKRKKILADMFGYLNEWIVKRSATPGNDLMSKIVTMDLNGRALTHDEKLGYLATTMFGGLDTVGGAMGFITKHLAEHPEHRAYLRANPNAIPAAVEEFLRRYSMPTISRTLTEDMMLGDVSAKAGDRVMISTIAHGVSDKRWGNAMEVDLQRFPQNHLAFGRGTHRCPGANLARAEIRIFIEEWLARIPEFRIAPGSKVSYAPGNVPGLKNLPLVWDL